METTEQPWRRDEPTAADWAEYELWLEAQEKEDEWRRACADTEADFRSSPRRLAEQTARDLDQLERDRVAAEGEVEPLPW